MRITIETNDGAATASPSSPVASAPALAVGDAFSRAGAIDGGAAPGSLGTESGLGPTAPPGTAVAATAMDGGAYGGQLAGTHVSGATDGGAAPA